MIRTCRSCGQKNRVVAAHLMSALRCGKCKAAIGPLDEPVEADSAIFDEIVGHAGVPVLVDFWASWCAPCRMAAPEVQKVARDMAGKAIVLKVDTEAYPALASRFNVQSIPNFVVIMRGRTVRQQPGVIDHAQMQRWLEAAAAGPA